MTTELIDYGKCQEYARALCGKYGIPPCDVEDIGSDAYLLSIRRAWRSAEGENPEAVAKRIMYTSTLNVINQRNSRSLRVLSDAETLYMTQRSETGTDDDVVEERFAATDHGAGTERLVDSLDWQYPFWLRLFDNARQRLRNEKRKAELKVIRLGLKDSRLTIIWQKSHFSWSRFQIILNILKRDFEPSFRALRAWRK